MKFKLATIGAIITTLGSFASQAATLNLTIVTNASIGLITTTTPALVSNGLPSGRAIVVSVTTTLNLVNVASSMNALLAVSNTTPAQFDTALGSLISATNPTLSASSNPGIVRTSTFTSGLISGTTSTQMGDAGNKGFLFLVAESGGFVTAIGAYTGPNTPGSGAYTLNPAFSGDGIGVGTSVLAAAGGSGPTLRNASGFQLVSAVPEPSAALLGAVGALLLLRRRRI